MMFLMFLIPILLTISNIRISEQKLDVNNNRQEKCKIFLINIIKQTEFKHYGNKRAKKANNTAATKAKQEKAGASVQKEQISPEINNLKTTNESYINNKTAFSNFEKDDYSKRAQMDRRASLTVMPKIGTSASTLFSDKVLYALGTKQVTLPFSKDRKFDNFYKHN